MDCQLSISISLKLYIKFDCHHHHQVGRGKRRCVTLGHLRVNVGHCVGSLEVIIGSILVNLSVGKDNLMVTVGQQG